MEHSAGVRVAAVIVSYNGEPWLQACLDSLKGATTRAHIIVVDNASTDRSVEIIRNASDVTLIETGSNLGFGRASNIGMCKALELGSDYVFLLNQDAHVASNALEILVKEADAHPEFGVLCPMQLENDGQKLDRTFLQFYLARNAPELIDDALLGRVETLYKIDVVPAAAWLLTRKCLLHVGGFDPLFFMYSEDDDLCSRAIHHGFGIAVVPNARFYHSRGFRRNVAVESGFRKLVRKTSRFRSDLVRDAKRPRGNFAKNAWHAITWRVFDGVGRAIGHLEWTICLASLLAAGRVLLELPRISRHRRICLREGPHWLGMPDGATLTPAKKR